MESEAVDTSDDVTVDPGSPAADPAIRPLPAWLALALVTGTSAAVLVLEILAARLLAPYVGISIETYTGIIGTVLAGIAVGAWLGGEAADRVDPHRLIPVLLVVGGALSIATIPIVRAVGDAFGGTGGFGILVLTAVGFLPSATVLSAIPPAVVKLQLRDLHSTGTTVGRLSAYGTAGAIVATFLTGFVLVAIAAVTTLIVWVGALLVVAGLAFWWWTGRELRATTAKEITAVSAFAALTLGGAALLGSPCDSQTEYYCVSIEADDERPSGRVLVLDDLRHSYVDLDDPTHLEFWYTRRFADVIDVLDPNGPIDVLHIGGGAMTVPTWVQTTRPDSEQVVMEIDGELVDLVVDEFDRSVGPGTGLRVAVGDARLSMGDVTTDSVDVVIGDAFGSRAVPWHLSTEEFVRDVQRVVRPGGVYAINVIDGGGQGFLRAETATIAAVFDNVVVVLGAAAADGRTGNSVIIASDEPIDVAGLASALVGDDGEFVADLDTFVGDADVLTDDFAPVDQLLARS